MSGSVLRSLKLFAALCGQHALPNVILVTTMWSEVREETGICREGELKAIFWKDMVAGGCRTARFENTYESAWRIVNSAVKKDGLTIISSHETIANNRRCSRSDVGIALSQSADGLTGDQRDETCATHVSHQDRVIV
jgi:hypothetical protein